jgi:ligand-binding sensor domain-containing protein
MLRCLNKLLLLLLLPLGSFAQQYKAVSLSLPEGLSQSSVYDIIQDKKGFTWMSTQDGLNKYDGITFQVYRDEPFDTNSISSNNTGPLLCDGKGRIWAGTANHGLNLFIPSKEGFRHFAAGTGKNDLSSNIITALYEDANGTVWIGTANGLHRMVEKGNGEHVQFSFERTFLKTNPEDSVPDKFIKAIMSDGNNMLWVGTYSGLFKFSLSQKYLSDPPVTWFSSRNKRIADNIVTALAVDNSGSIWVGGRNGINIIRYPGETISLLTKDNSSMNSNQVSNLFTSTQGDIWTGYNDRGIQVVRNSSIISGQPLFEKVPVANQLQVLNNGNAISFREDRITPGVIWVGFNAGGAVRLIPVTKKFITNDLANSPISTSFVTGIIKDNNNTIWIGTQNGLLNYDRTTREYKLIRPSEHLKNKAAEDYINGPVPVKNGEVIFGCGANLFRAQKSAGKILIKSISLPAEIKDNYIRTVTTDAYGNIYVVLRYSVYKFDIATELFSPVVKIENKNKLEDKAYFLSCYYVDHSGNHWLGTSSGLEFFPVARVNNSEVLSKPVTYYHNQKDTTSLRNQNILSIAEDKNHNIWIGTMNGLTRVVTEKGRKQFRNFSTHDGLKNNVIYAIIPDDKSGHLWLSTNNGLTEFNPRGFAVATYDVKDGLQSNEFNSYAAYKAPDGEMFFGGIQGYTSFYPDQILRDHSTPSVSITNIKFDDNRTLNLADLEESKVIDLKYKDNSFTVNFVGLHYVDPQKNQYAYKLEGFQSDWTYAGNSTRVNFSQLPPGKYIFRVKAANSDGEYNPEGDKFVINIKPPFYKTIWFYLLIAMFIAAVLWGLHKYRLSMKLAQIREVEKIRRATAADFHDELGHKLTIISWFAEILKKKIGPEQLELRPHLDKIIETSGTLYHTMKDMLWAMDPDKDSVYDLYSQIREFGQELFDNTGVLFEATDISEELKQRIISPAHKRHVLLIFKEVMHNSLKHAHSTSTNLELVRDENMVKFRFRDNGTGFKMNGHNVGNGLNNVKRRAQMIHARIDIHSEGNGTVAELNVPFENLNIAV